MLDVHQEQPLVLLLMMEAEFEDRGQLVQCSLIHSLEEVAQSVADVGAVDVDVMGTRDG